MITYNGSLKIELINIENGININYNLKSIKLKTNLSLIEINEIIKTNFLIVKNYYAKKDNNKIIDLLDMDLICFKVVLNYLSMYLFWREKYPRERNRNLIFIEKDFNNPTCHDILIVFFKKKYPFDYFFKISILLDMQIEDAKKYITNRIDFLNMW